MEIQEEKIPIFDVGNANQECLPSPNLLYGKLQLLQHEEGSDHLLHNRKLLDTV